MRDSPFKTVYPLWIALKVTIPVLIIVLLVVFVVVDKPDLRDPFNLVWLAFVVAHGSRAFIPRVA